MRPNCVGKIKQGDAMVNICYSCNLQGCPDAAWGAKCRKGFHGCAKKKPDGSACGGAHKFTECNS